MVASTNSLRLTRNEAEIDLLNEASSIVTDEKNQWVQSVFDVVEPYLKTRSVAKGATFTVTFGHLPTIILEPGEPEMAHKTGEFCYISKIEEGVEIYTKIAEGWCS